MDSTLFSVLLIVTVLATPVSAAEDPVGAESHPAANHSMLSEFVDPEMKFAEGCGCYMRRRGATEGEGLLFFGKLGDQKESGWIALGGKLMEVLKEKPHSTRIENGKRVRTQSYRSSDVIVRVELIEQQVNEAEETATYTGEVTVSADGRTETVRVTGTCGC